MTRKATMSSISAMEGLTLPGMMDEPGCTAGRRDVAQSGREDPSSAGAGRRRSCASSTAKPRSAPEKRTKVVVALGHLEVVAEAASAPSRSDSLSTAMTSAR